MTVQFAQIDTIVLTGIAVIVVVLLFRIIGVYNRLTILRNRYKNAYSQIDAQLKRRYDLIPNLVETVKGCMGHERATLEAVINARNVAVVANRMASANPGDANVMRSLGSAETELSGTLLRLFALSETYPDLKANQTTMNLQKELTSTENKIVFARRAFNDSVMYYNTARQIFPNVLCANMLGFTEARLFEIESPKELEVPRVWF
jgi:LemA protein